MSIYTKTGDKGNTRLYDGNKVRKDNPIIKTLGVLDELSVFVGCCTDIEHLGSSVNVLRSLQYFIQQASSIIATPDNNRSDVMLDLELCSALNQAMETFIDEVMEKHPLTQFILTVTVPASKWTNLARVKAREAERAVVSLLDAEEVAVTGGVVYIENELLKTHVLPVLNRMSDYFFALSRHVSPGYDVFHETHVERVKKSVKEV